MVLYLDCDGVILDTIEACYKLMRDEGLNDKDKNIVHEYFLNVDWNYLIYRAGVLNNSIINIKNIIESNKFKDVIILTKISGNLGEEKCKRILFSKLLPDVKVLAVPYDMNKNDFVDPRGNVLVDDEMKNVLNWIYAGGIGIYYVRNNPNYELNEIDNLKNLNKTKRLR